MTDPPTLPELPGPPRLVGRYRPGEPLPPYRYVPAGPHPHPVTGDGGHFVGRAFDAPDPLSPLAWMVNPLWLFGVDLFNNHYFWEAHEVWEPLWRELDKAQPPGLMIHACMQCAGLMLKVHAQEREGAAAFWERAHLRLTQLVAIKELWGLKPKRVLKDFSKYLAPLADGRMPAIDKRVPKLKLAM
jgi:hypothetical protein